MRRLALLADQLSDPAAVHFALAGELLAAVGGHEVRIHHLGEGATDELAVVYLVGGDARLSYFLPRRERPPGIDWVASTGRPFVAPNVDELAVAVPQLAAVPGAARALLLALRIRGVSEAVVIVVRDAAARRFTELELELASTLVDQAAMLLALLRARAEAGVDPVSGSMNHRAMRERLSDEINRAARARSPLSCLVLDLDDFKSINDRYGHQAGDEVLRALASALVSEVRAFDCVARYGGDEFVVILPNADLSSAVAAAHRVLERLERLSIGPGPQGASASIGVAQWRRGMSTHELLGAGDAALLSSKRAGKGRVSATPVASAG